MPLQGDHRQVKRSCQTCAHTLLLSPQFRASHARYFITAAVAAAAAGFQGALHARTYARTHVCARVCARIFTAAIRITIRVSVNESERVRRGSRRAGRLTGRDREGQGGETADSREAPPTKASPGKVKTRSNEGGRLYAYASMPFRDVEAIPDSHCRQESRKGGFGAFAG
jgi:hypothetical protein